ncbi:hypothetical protein VTK73DRAFT_583 [Phialemonium thermophilum]|uniref:NDT80 domain-containing protein n=1 Tax=Phialemonium thermophilum TaxID=223376 RepID=A0ABR3VUP8_9PEZI
MATYNTMQAMSSGTASGADALGLNGGGQSLGIDSFDQDLRFDESLLGNVGGNLPHLPFTPTYDFDAFSTTFEDPFSYPSVRHFGGVAPPDGDTFHPEESSPRELDDKLLGFGAPIITAPPVVDESVGRGPYPDLDMTAELYGMFFVAEDVFGSENTTPRPLELTCYRRNLWQCSGQVTVPRHLSAVVDEQGRQVPVVELAASITAVESIEGKPTEIISIPWKSTATNPPPGAVVADEAKVASAPPRIPLDLSGGQELDGNRVSVPVTWKRLQFKHATANNGRRKGLQQHYVVQINLLGKTDGGDYIKIAEIQSGPVIVRGRSPRNFDGRKDVPLMGDKRLERRGTDASAASVTPKLERTEPSQMLQRFQSMAPMQPGDWTTPQPTYHQHGQHPSKKLALSPTATRPPVPAWSADSIGGPAPPPLQSGGYNGVGAPSTPTLARTGSFQARSSGGGGGGGGGGGSTLPINLSLSEDERSPNRSSSDSLQSPQFSKSTTAGPGTAGTGAGSGPSGAPESDDMLYEYFPLSLDDWTPPVDAIYRPHVVHHTIIPPEVKAQQTRSRTKRYFAAD